MKYQLILETNRYTFGNQILMMPVAKIVEVRARNTRYAVKKGRELVRKMNKKKIRGDRWFLVRVQEINISETTREVARFKRRF